MSHPTRIYARHADVATEAARLQHQNEVDTASASPCLRNAADVGHRGPLGKRNTAAGRDEHAGGPRDPGERGVHETARCTIPASRDRTPGEQLRDDLLEPGLEQAIRDGRTLVVDLRGAEFGYPIGFLEEAFGGLARKVPEAPRHIRLVDDDNETAETVRQLMAEAGLTADERSRRSNANREQ